MLLIAHNKVSLSRFVEIPYNDVNAHIYYSIFFLNFIIFYINASSSFDDGMTKLGM